jgi:hypothetical protein
MLWIHLTIERQILLSQFISSFWTVLFLNPPNFHHVSQITSLVHHQNGKYQQSSCSSLWFPQIKLLFPFLQTAFVGSFTLGLMYG